MDANGLRPCLLTSTAIAANAGRNLMNDVRVPCTTSMSKVRSRAFSEVEAAQPLLACGVLGWEFVLP